MPAIFRTEKGEYVNLDLVERVKPAQNGEAVTIHFLSGRTGTIRDGLTVERLLTVLDSYAHRYPA